MKKQNDRIILVQKHLDYFDDDSKLNNLYDKQPTDSILSSPQTQKQTCDSSQSGKSYFSSILSSTLNFGKKIFRAGGLFGSVFSLVAATVGSGNITLAYAIMKNGYILGPLIVAFGALLSYYTSMLLVKSADFTGKVRYEDIALQLYGPKASKITSVLCLLCLIGFSFSFIVYIKTAIPIIVELYTNNEKIRSWIGRNNFGEHVSGIGSSLLILFPLSIPRTASSLTFSSLIGVLCSAYLSIAVATVFFSDKTYIPSINDNLNKMDSFKFTQNGIISSFPLIIYAYMYQVNIPMIYVELENRSPKQMSKVILVGSSILVILFCFVGVFGYATFVNQPEQLCSKNILDNNYYDGITLMQVSYFTMLFSVISSFPLVILPSKDSIEELFMNGQKLSSFQNIMVTFLLVSMNCCLALFIPNIGQAMTLVGSTINPLIGFIIPILFYQKQIKNQPWYSIDKLFSIFVIILIISVSGLSLYQFFEQDDTQLNDPEFC